MGDAIVQVFIQMSGALYGLIHFKMPYAQHTGYHQSGIYAFIPKYDYARAAGRVSTLAIQVMIEVRHRNQIAAHIAQPSEPGHCIGDPRILNDTEYFDHIIQWCEECLLADPKTDACPRFPLVLPGG